MKDSILFIVDHKHRDLPGLSLIGYYLEKYFKHRVFYCPTSMESKIIAKEDPKYIVIPKLSYGIYNQLKWKLEGRLIIIVETEGNPQSIDTYYRIIVYPDYYIFWNDHVKNHYYKKLQKNRTRISVEGYYRSDFFCEPFKHIYDKKNIKLDLGIKNNPMIVTIATSTQDAHLSQNRKKRNKNKRNIAYKNTPNYDIIIKSLNIQKQITEQFLLEIQKEFNNEIIFVIKPHPNESILYWIDLINNNNISNCYLMLGKDINELLCISDFHISHGVCSTTAEAMLCGLRTLELVTYLSNKIYSKSHLNLPNHQCYSSSEMIDVIKKIIIEDKRGREENKINNYADKYFKKVDGRVCHQYASKIDDFVINSNRDSRLTFFNLIKYNIIFFLMKVRNKILIKRRITNKNIVEEVNFPEKNSTENSKYRIINGKYVHIEYGLYDNKITPDDYKYWYKKFDEIGA
jgi:surface carbohydrate biosynthesis protein